VDNFRARFIDLIHNRELSGKYGVCLPTKSFVLFEYEIAGFLFLGRFPIKLIPGIGIPFSVPKIISPFCGSIGAAIISVLYISFPKSRLLQ
jgi:hypothetical protein